MGQRVMIAMMLVAEPDLLIADEPTSALDVTVQNEVLRILDDLVRDRGMGLIFISHNLTVVSSFCDRVLIMYGGKIVEECAAKDLHQAKHPYTRALVGCRSLARRAANRTCDRHPRPGVARMIDVQDLNVTFRNSGRSIRAVQGVSFDVAEGETFGIVGESGSGKSTVLKAIAGLVQSTSAALTVDGQAGRAAPQPRGPAPDAVRVPGPLRLAASAPDGRRHPARTARSSTAKPTSMTQVTEAIADVGLLPIASLSLSAPAVGRPAPARGHRPRAHPAGRRSCCWTSRPRRSTFRCRPKSSISCPGCGRATA